jgi:hypothetical protein
LTTSTWSPVVTTIEAVAEVMTPVMLAMDGVAVPVEDVPELVEPELVEPELVEPELVEPELVEPELVEPELVDPELVEPELDEPELVEPDVVVPEVDCPQAGKIDSLLMHTAKSAAETLTTSVALDDSGRIVTSPSGFYPIRGTQPAGLTPFRCRSGARHQPRLGIEMTDNDGQVERQYGPDEPPSPRCPAPDRSNPD